MRWLPTLAEGDVHDWSGPAEWSRWNVSLRFAVARAWPAEQSRSSNTELGTPGTRFAFYMPDLGIFYIPRPHGTPSPRSLNRRRGFCLGHALVSTDRPVYDKPTPGVQMVGTPCQCSGSRSPPCGICALRQHRSA